MTSSFWKAWPLACVVALIWFAHVVTPNGHAIWGVEAAHALEHEPPGFEARKLLSRTVASLQWWGAPPGELGGGSADVNPLRGSHLTIDRIRWSDSVTLTPGDQAELVLFIIRNADDVRQQVRDELQLALANRAERDADVR